jgi:hypothetical protein
LKDRGKKLEENPAVWLELSASRQFLLIGKIEGYFQPATGKT